MNPTNVNTSEVFPDEVIHLIIKNLEKPGIIQCQTTCKQWYHASIEKLYGSVELRKNNQLDLFITSLSAPKSIENMRKNYVKKVFFRRSGIGRRFTTPHDFNQLTRLFALCKNLEVLEGYDQSLTWTALQQASNRGYLTQLQDFPSPTIISGIYGENYKCYVKSALLFNYSLRNLSVCEKRMFKPRRLDPSYDTKSFRDLSTRLVDFFDLRSLQVGRHIAHGKIRDFDSMIEDCQKLEHFTVAFTNTIEEQEEKQEEEPYYQKSYRQLPDVRPRPTISRFIGFGLIIRDDDAMKYIMQKFPNLNRLQIITHYYTFQLKQLSPQVLADFFIFMAKIPTLSVDLALRRDNIIDLWINVLKRINFKGMNKVEYRASPSRSHAHEKLIVTRSTEVKSSIMEDVCANLYFHPQLDQQYQPHIQFILKAGQLIQNLTIKNIKHIQNLTKAKHGDDELVDGYWLASIFSNCPLLKSLVLDTPGYVTFVSNADIGKNESLECLTIRNLWQRYNEDIYPITKEGIYKQLSERLPSLKRLHLFNTYGISSNYCYEDIDMQFNTLETFTWSRINLTAAIEDDWKVYFMIKTNNGVSFYCANTKMITAISGAEYSNARNTDNIQCIYLQCKKLKHLCVKLRDYPDTCYLLSLTITLY